MEDRLNLTVQMVAMRTVLWLSIGAVQWTLGGVGSPGVDGAVAAAVVLVAVSAFAGHVWIWLRRGVDAWPIGAEYLPLAVGGAATAITVTVGTGGSGAAVCGAVWLLNGGVFLWLWRWTRDWSYEPHFGRFSPH